MAHKLARGKKQLYDGRDVHIFHFTILTKIVWDTSFVLAFFVRKLKGHSFEIIFELSHFIILIYRSRSAGQIWKFYNLNRLIALYISFQSGMMTSGLNCWQRWHPSWCISLLSSCIRSVTYLLLYWFYIFYHVALETNLQNDFITQTFHFIDCNGTRRSLKIVTVMNFLFIFYRL